MRFKRASADCGFLIACLFVEEMIAGLAPEFLALKANSLCYLQNWAGYFGTFPFPALGSSRECHLLSTL